MFYLQRGKRRFRGSEINSGDCGELRIPSHSRHLKNFVVWMGRHQDIAFTQNNDPFHHIKPIFMARQFLDLNFFDISHSLRWFGWDGQLRNGVSSEAVVPI